jgi:hypothetical protein
MYLMLGVLERRQTGSSAPAGRSQRSTALRLSGAAGCHRHAVFSLVSARYERASLIVTSNTSFSAWGEIFGDEATAVAMIDRLVHHAEILSLEGDSYRLRGKDLGARPAAEPAQIG